MRTNTEKYEATHGRKPRGRGLWGFLIKGRSLSACYWEEVVFQHGTLTEARKLAVAEAKATAGQVAEIIEIIVLP